MYDLSETGESYFRGSFYLQKISVRGMVSKTRNDVTILYRQDDTTMSSIGFGSEDLVNYFSQKIRGTIFFSEFFNIGSAEA